MCMGMWRRLGTLAALVLLAGCGAALPHSGAQTGTLAGLVELSACGGPPVDSPAPCTFRPMAGAQIEFQTGSQIVNRAVTDSAGRYSVSVAAGTYTVHVVVVHGVAITEDSRTVKVEPGQRVVTDFHLMFQAV